MSKVRQVIKSIRRDFNSGTLDKKNVNRNPIRQFEIWMQEAISTGLDEPNAMTLATCGRDGQPDLRVLLLRDVNEKGFSFFTNYKSRKGRQLAARKKAAINFYWPEMNRQVRIQGLVEKLPASESDAYFESRPRESQIGAWASDQSEVLDSRKELEDTVREMEKKFSGKKVSRPPHWGGYRLRPVKIEFWQGRVSRLHDRILFEKGASGRWKINRLNP